MNYLYKVKFCFIGQYWNIWTFNILRFWVHLMNGFPVKPWGQLQIGLWLLHWQIAAIPQAPMQGFIHFWLEQIWLVLQSELLVHSGLHVGGFPMYPGMQEQLAWSFIDRQRLLGPHKDGLHGSGSIGSNYEKILKSKACLINKTDLYFLW